MHDVLTFLQSNQAILGLFLLAAIMAMRPTLPAPFRGWEWLEWGYEWLHETLETFVSLRGGRTKEPPKNEPPEKS